MGMGTLRPAKKPLWLHSICNPLIAATHVIRIVVQMRALLVNAGVVGSTSPQRLTNHDQIVCGSIFFLCQFCRRCILRANNHGLHATVVCLTAHGDFVFLFPGVGESLLRRRQKQVPSLTAEPSLNQK